MESAILAVAVGFLMPAVALAHHPSTVEFDVKRPVNVKGVVTKVEWINPHAYLHLDVTGPAGQVTKWRFETGSPSQLTKRTWTRTAVKAGDQITVEGYRARNGANFAAAKSVTMADGRTVFAGRLENEKGKD